MLALGLGQCCVGEVFMIDRNYLARHAMTLLKIAQSTADRDVAAALINRAADLKSRIDDYAVPDLTPVAPDIKSPPVL